MAVCGKRHVFEASALRCRVSALFIVAACAFAVVAFGMHAEKAFAITEETEAEVTKTQKELEESSKRYEEISAQLESMEERVAQNRVKLDQLEGELAERRRSGAASMRILYFIQEDMPGLIEMVLASQDIDSFMRTYEYITKVYDSQVAELLRLSTLHEQTQATQQQLDDDLDNIAVKEQEAASALREAQEAREAVKAKARAEAEEEARKAEAERQAALAKQKEMEEKENAAKAESSSSSASFGAVSADGADWSTDKATFVSEWTSRIDAYLAGSPLSGQGATFAAAAWDYGIDPRFSPAISNTESSKGRYCFKPHNAWGWGSSSWGSWEEAIYAHAAGLAHGYGYTLSVSGAKKYCPPNWENWYRNTLSQMEMI